MTSSPTALVQEIDGLRTAWLKLARQMAAPVGEWPAHWLMTPEFLNDLRRYAWPDGDFIQVDIAKPATWRVLQLGVEVGTPAESAHWQLIAPTAHAEPQAGHAPSEQRG